MALTERFIEVMESEHRELGLGDPTLGKTVRKLVGALARRTELWRSATAAAKAIGAMRCAKACIEANRRQRRCTMRRRRCRHVGKARAR